MSTSEFKVKFTVDKERADSAIKGFKNSFTEFMSKVDTARFALDTFTGVFTKALEVGKEGARLQLASDQFDNLAISIGSTSDAIINRLGEATSGMMSNAQMIESASQIISLGLADNEDDVVRLATVVSELGWDMNQVILTFANNSKMRLDALGLSVTDVDAKMEAFIAQGHDMDKAFDLAVLQAGEEKIALLGSSADTAVGDFKRLEAQLQNSSDEIKLKLLPGLTNAAKGLALLLTWNDKIDAALADQKRNLSANAESWEEYAIGVVNAYEAAGRLSKGQAEFARANIEAGKSLGKLADWLDIMTEAELKGLQAGQAVAEQRGYTAQDMLRYADMLRESTGAVNEHALRLADLQSAYTDLSMYIDGPLGKAQESFEENMAALTQRAQDLTIEISELEGLSYLTDDQEKQLGELRTELGNVQADIEDTAIEHEKATKRIIYGILQQQLAYLGLEGSPEHLQFMLDLAESWGLIDEDTKRATEAAREYLLSLGEQTGKLGEYNAAQAELILGLREIDQMPSTKELTIAMELDPKFNGLTSWMNKKKSTSIYVGLSGPGAGMAKGGGGGSTQKGSGKNKATGFAGGAESYDVPRGFPGDSFGPVYFTGGERLTVQPANEARKRDGMVGGSDGGSVHVYLDGDEIAARIERRQGHALRRSLTSGSFRRGR